MYGTPPDIPGLVQTNITNCAEEKWALLDKDIEMEDSETENEKGKGRTILLFYIYVYIYIYQVVMSTVDSLCCWLIMDGCGSS